MDKRRTSKSGNFSDNLESNFNQGKVVLDLRNIGFNQKGSTNMHYREKLNHKPEASKHDNVGNTRHNYTVPGPFSLATEERHGSTDEATASKEKPGRADNFAYPTGHESTPDCHWLLLLCCSCVSFLYLFLTT